MDYNLLLEFIIYSTLNVVIQTAKSIITYKGGKFAAASANAIAYSLYTYIIVLTMCELPIELKAAVTGIVNFIGVYIVKWAEEKTEKTKLWKVELTVPTDMAVKLQNGLEAFGMSYDAGGRQVGKWTTFTTFCYTKKDSSFVKEIADRYNAKYFVSESKTL